MTPVWGWGVFPCCSAIPTTKRGRLLDAWMFGEWLLVAPITERVSIGEVGSICRKAPLGLTIIAALFMRGGQYIPYSLNSEVLPTFRCLPKKAPLFRSKDRRTMSDRKLWIM